MPTPEIKPKRWRYKPSQNVRKHIAHWEGSDFEKQNLEFGGDAISAKAAEFSRIMGDRGKYFTQSELDGMFSTFYNLAPSTFNREFMSLIDNYVGDTSFENLQALKDTMANRWVLSKKQHQRGIRNRAAADVNLMNNATGYQLPDSRKVIFPKTLTIQAVSDTILASPVQPLVEIKPFTVEQKQAPIAGMDQQDVWNIFDKGATIYGDMPKPMLPDIGELVSSGKNKYFADMLGLSSLYDTGNLNYEFAPFMISAKNGKLPRFEDGNSPNIPGPVTVLGNVANSVINPKLTIERLMRQRADGTRDVEDVLRAVLLNQGGDYTGHEGGSMNNRDLVGLYLYGNDKGFKKINPADNIGHSYDNEIIASGRDPRNINTYYGKFPVKNGPIILPKYAEQLVRALAASGIPVTKQLNSKPADGFDDVARFLATLTLKNGLPVVSYSDMWDFMPDQYSGEYGEKENFWHYMQAYAADKAGTPFILRQTVPILFSGENSQRIFANDLDNPDLETSILLRAGVLPEVNVYPEPKVLTPKQREERKAKLEAAFLKQQKEMSTWKNGKLPKLKPLWKR